MSAWPVLSPNKMMEVPGLRQVLRLLKGMSSRRRLTKASHALLNLSPIYRVVAIGIDSDARNRHVIASSGECEHDQVSESVHDTGT